MADNIKFSILVPVYNAELYIDECIQSVLQQTYDNYELILVDDGSEDHSGEICDKYSAMSPKIKAYHKDNKGPLHTRCFGIEKASGDYLVFLDADDFLSDNALMTINDKVQHYHCDCVIYKANRVINGEVIRVYPNVKGNDKLYIDKRELYNLVFNGEYNAIWMKAVRTTILKNKDYTKFYHIKIGEDAIHSIEIYKTANKVLLINDTLYNYRLTPGSLMQTISYENFRVSFAEKEEVLNLLEQEDIFNEKDYVIYRKNCWKWFVHFYIGRIAKFKTLKENKVELYNLLKEEPFYKTFISNGKTFFWAMWRESLAFFAFKYNLYNMIFFFSKFV